MTAPESAARQPASTTFAHGIRRDTYVSGNLITAIGDDGTTITLDQSSSPASMFVNGQAVPLAADAADSVRSILMRMYTAEQQAQYVTSKGSSGGGVPPSDGVWNPPPPDPRCPVYAIICDGNGSFSSRIDPLSAQSTHGVRAPRGSVPAELGALAVRRAGQPYVLGTPHVGVRPTALGTSPMSGASTMSSGGPVAGSAVGFDIGFNCTDVSLSIYNEMPNFRAAKTALLDALAANVLNLLSGTRGVPPTYPDPSSWLGWGRLYAAGPSLDALFANYEDSRLKLGTYAVMFNAQDCIHDTSPPSPGTGLGGGDFGPGAPGPSGGGGQTCYEMEYYYTDTGEIYAVEDMGCV